ncbi:MAG: tetratricopeptide repeat protein [Pyrinomonadaceae bacterium]
MSKNLDRLKQSRSESVPRLIVWLALALTFLAYVGTLSYQFVYDDNQQIVLNRFLTSWRYVPRYFTEHVWGHQNPNAPGNYYRPIFLLWLYLNRCLFGLQPVWWHLATVAAHVCVTFLVYLLVHRIVRDRLTAGVAALFFGLHPIHIEAVAWVSGVTEPLLALMLIPSFLCYLNWRERTEKRRWWFAASLALYVLAMLAKETALVLPVIIVAYEFGLAEHAQDQTKQGKRTVKRNALAHRVRAALVSVVPYLLLSIVYLIIRAIVLKGVAHSLTPLPFKTTLLTLPSILWFYIKSLVWPVGLSVFYDLPYVTEITFMNFVLPCVAVLAVAILLGSWARRSEPVAFAVIWLVLPILPVLNISVFFEGELAHDRYLYLPSIGFAMLVALAVRQLDFGRTKILGEPLAQVLIVLTLACLWNQATVREAGYWSDNFALYSRGMSVAPNNFLAINNLGTALAKRGRHQEAIELYKEALARKPFYWSANCNLGYSYYQLGKFDDAEQYLERAIAIYPNEPRQFLCLGMTQMKLGRLDEAANTIRHALELKPEGADYHYALGRVLQQQGDLTGALNEFEAELAMTPDHSGARKEMSEIRSYLANRGQGNFKGPGAQIDFREVER